MATKKDNTTTILLIAAAAAAVWYFFLRTPAPAAAPAPPSGGLPAPLQPVSQSTGPGAILPPIDAAPISNLLANFQTVSTAPPVDSVVSPAPIDATIYKPGILSNAPLAPGSQQQYAV